MLTPTLRGLRVLDIGLRLSSAWCSRLLADFGADVVMVERSIKHESRSHPPFDEEGRSILARYLLSNKKVGDPSLCDQMLSDADVIVTSNLSADVISESHPEAIVVAITPYGQTGEYRYYPGNDLTAYARSGWAFVNGLQGQAPLKGSGYQASYQAGTLAFGSVISALIEKSASREGGQLVDISEFETLVSTSAPAPLRYQYSGQLWKRRSMPVDMTDGPTRVKDGYFALPLSRPIFWQKALTILGLPDLADDPELQQVGSRNKYVERFQQRVAQELLRWKRMELFDALAAQRVIAGPVLGMDEMSTNPQFEARNFLQMSPDSKYRFPSSFAKMSRSEWKLRSEFGSKTKFRGFDASNQFDTNPVRSEGSCPKGKGPLAGFRGLVLTQAWAGTYATELLGFLGADIVQVEVRKRLDSWRGNYDTPMPDLLRQVETARHPWNCNALYNSVNLNKRCVTIDLSEPDGLAIFKQLVPHFDFVAENFSPRVMGNLGLSYEDLTLIKPDIIFASLSAYGANGPWSKVPGIGGTIEPSSGMSSLLGYEGGEPQNSGQMYPDPVAGICGFSAIAMALLHRDRTGDGQYVDLSMQEANFTFIGDAWLEYEILGDGPTRMGNRHRRDVPHGIYRAAGDDEWIAIAAQDDEQWVKICDTLAIKNRWKIIDDRRKAENEIDALIEQSTIQWSKETLSSALSVQGVCSAPVLNSVDVKSDTVLRKRHMVQTNHPETGPMWQSGVPMILSRTPGHVSRPAPLQGEHSYEIFSEYIGMTKEQFEDLERRGITGKGEVPIVE